MSNSSAFALILHQMPISDGQVEKKRNRNFATMLLLRTIVPR